MHTYRWHPALKATINGPTVRNMPLHLQQSDLDGACGPHCALMALMLFGVLARHDLDGLPRARKRRLSSLWKHTQRRYFIGAYTSHLQSVLAPFARDVRCSVRRKDCVTHVLTVINDAGVGIIQIGNEDFQHWVLAVGFGGMDGERGVKPALLLILDPSHPPIPMTPWNAVLSVRTDGQERHTYDTPGGRVRVRVDSVLALRLTH